MKVDLMAGLVLLMATSGFAQTAGELLQKGIYTQETAGDLDGAISIYRQIVNSGSSPRDLAAQAQYRLAQSLLQKGDLGNAASEFEKLARSYADYGKLVSGLAAQAQVVTAASRAVQEAKAALANARTDQQAADRTRLVEAGLAKLKAEADAEKGRHFVIDAKPIAQVVPVYPVDLEAKGIEGTVLLRATISKNGVPTSIQYQSGDPAFYSAAVAAVVQWRYAPPGTFFINGAGPIDADQYIIPVRFRLPNK